MTRKYAEESNNQRYERRDRIKDILLRIGEKSDSTPVENISIVSRAILKDMENLEDTIMDTFFQAIICLPHKIGIYGNLIGLVNASEKKYGQNFVNRLQNEISMCLENSNYSKLISYNRFAAELFNANVISGADFTTYLTNLFDAVMSLKSDLPLKLIDFFVYTIIIVLPNSGEKLISAESEEFYSLLRKVTEFFNSRTPQYTPTAITSQNPYDHLQIFWDALKHSSNTNWKLSDSIITSYYSQFGDKLESAQNHPFAIKDIKIYPTASIPLFCPLLQLYNPPNSKKEPQTLKTLVLFHYYTQVCAAIDINPNICAKELQEISQRSESPELLVESIFSLLFKLPFPPNSLVFYNILVVKLFSSRVKSNFSPLVGKAIQILFANLSHLEIECRDRLADWFAFHLSNFSFKWPWDKWSFVCSEPPQLCRRVFCESVLRKCAELAPNFRLMNDQMKELVPLAPEPRFDLRLFGSKKVKNEENEENNENNNGNFELCLKLRESIEAKEDWRAQKLILLQMRECMGEEESVAVWFQCLLFYGRESISQVLKQFDSIKPAYVEMDVSEAAQRKIVQTVILFWEESHFHVEFILVKLITFNFVNSLVLVDELLSENAVEKFYQPIFSRIITVVLDRSSVKVKALNNALEKLPEEKVERHKEAIQRLEKGKRDVLLLVLKRLSQTANKLKKSVEDCASNDGMYHVISARISMFMRRYGDTFQGIKEEFRVFCHDNKIDVE